MTAKLLRDARMDKNWSQENLALAAGLTPVQISHIENGKCYPRKPTQRALENALGCNLSFTAEKKPTGRPKQMKRTINPKNNEQ